MAKIGIVTFHKAHNFGAILQAMALRTVLAEMGHDVAFIDYWPEYHKREYKVFNTDYFKSVGTIGKAKYLIRFFQNYNAKMRKARCFNDFIDSNISPYCTTNFSDKFDFVVYGSDQIWRKMPEIGYKYDGFYFGVNNLSSKFHCSYAASMGIENTTEADKRFLYDSLINFSYVNVRELSLKNLLESCGIGDIKVGLDPTLLLEEDKWREILSLRPYHGDNYVLFYDLIPDSFIYNEILEYASDRGLALKIVTGAVSSKKYYGHNVKVYDHLNPCEFVELIANADTVFSSSFHGLVFSIMFKKNFYTCFRKNASRATSLLNQLGLGHRLIASGEKIDFSAEAIDYGNVCRMLNKLRIMSLDDIANMLSM